MNLNAMKLSTRLTAGFGVVTVLAMSIAAFSGWQQFALSKELDTVANNRMVKVEQFSQVQDNLDGMARRVRNILLVRDTALEDAERRRLAELRASNAKLLGELDPTLRLPRSRELFQVIQDTGPQFDRAIDQVVALDAKGETEAATRLLMSEASDLQNRLFKAVDDSALHQQELARTLADEARASARQSTLLMLGMAFLAAAVGGLVGWRILRNLSRQLGAEPAELSAAASQVAAGDLAPVPGAARAPQGSVLAALGDMQQSLAQIVAQVRTSSDSIATGSSQIATGNADLSHRTEEQASALQQTAATMEELSGTVRHNAEGARQADQLAKGAAGVAGRGGEVVGQVVSTMQSIQDSSRRIGDIIGVIDSIAFQTNILALNAAVEAARAGEQGRGFAVVAGEVRSLAQRSAEAAREIKALIGRNVEQVEQGTALVDRAGQTMQEIVASIQRVSDIVGEISSATAEQSNGIDQVGGAVTRMDQMTQQNAALVEQSAAAAESLKTQAQQLVNLVSVFRLASGQAARMAPARPADNPAIRPTAQAPAAAATTSRPTRSAATAVNAPAASPKAAAATAEANDDWTLF
jgi:methyl-accepting chemotaxis protein